MVNSQQVQPAHKTLQGTADPLANPPQKQMGLMAPARPNMDCYGYPKGWKHTGSQTGLPGVTPAFKSCQQGEKSAL